MEIDPNGKQPKEPGSKLDAGKPNLYQGLLAYFPRACREIAAVSTFGAIKYSWKGWESVPKGFERYSDALVRHLTSEGAGETEDRDSKFSHAAHVAWNALARLELLLKEKENDIFNQQSLSGLDWTTAQLLREQHRQSQEPKTLSEEYFVVFDHTAARRANLEHSTDGRVGQCTRKTTDVYCATPWGYLSEDIAKANTALQKELDND